MNPVKTEIKLAMLRDAGKQYDQQKLKVEGQLMRLDGQVAGFRTALERIGELHKALEEERDTELVGLDGEQQITAAKFAKKFLNRAWGCVSSLKDSAEHKRAVAMGSAQTYARILETVEKQHQAELASLEAFNLALEKGDVVMEDGGPMYVGEDQAPSGVHPGPTLKQRRLAEEEAADGQNA